jgi:hypothetical protein
MGQKATNSAASQPRIPRSFQELAARQGVQPVMDFDALLGHPSAGDESAEEFAVMLRKWRSEGAFSKQTQ